MSNSVNLSLDVTKTGIQNPLIKVRQGDGGFETLHTTVTSNGEPLDLQGWTITFMGTTAGNHKIVDGNVNIVEAPNGIFDYTPSKAWGMDIGEFKIAYFKFVKGDGAASSANFRVNVIEAVDLTQEEAQNYISVVDTTIAEAKQHLTDSLASVTASVAATSSAASSMAVYVSSTASSAVSQVSSAASNASSVASSAAAKVSGVAAQVNNLSIGSRNYILNSKRTLSGVSVQDTGWVDTSIPISTLSNSIFTISVQIDYDNVTAATSGSRLGFEIIAAEVTADGSTPARYFGAWRIAKVGESFHGRVYATFDMRGKTLKSVYTPSRWGGGLYSGAATATNVSVSNPKLEIGNIATDWTPAPEDADNTFLKKTNQLPAEARDFNYLATHMQTYQGTWWVGNEIIANAPIAGWNSSTIEVVPGNAETAGVIRTSRFGTNATYSANVNSGKLGPWLPLTPSSRAATFSDLAVVAKSMSAYAGTWYAVGKQNIQNGPTIMNFNSIITVVNSWDDAGFIIVSSQGYNTWIGGVAGGNIQHWTFISDDANVVHNTGTETIAGDKTLTGTLDANQKVHTRTIGSTNDLQIVYTRAGNIVTGRFIAKTAGTFTLSGNDGYKSNSGYPVNVIGLNVDAFFTNDNKFTIKGAAEGNFMFITSDALPTN